MINGVSQLSLSEQYDRQIVMGLGKVRVIAQCLLKVKRRGFQLTLAQQDATLVIVHAGSLSAFGFALHR
jgi:hypothetical protein